MEIPTLWKMAFPNMKMNPYLHFLCHVPMLLIKWSCLASRNNQGKEASHVFRRKLQCSSSNNDAGKASSIPNTKVSYFYSYYSIETLNGELQRVLSFLFFPFFYTIVNKRNHAMMYYI